MLRPRRLTALYDYDDLYDSISPYIASYTQWSFPQYSVSLLVEIWAPSFAATSTGGGQACVFLVVAGRLLLLKTLDAFCRPSILNFQFSFQVYQ